MKKSIALLAGLAALSLCGGAVSEPAHTLAPHGVANGGSVAAFPRLMRDSGGRIGCPGGYEAWSYSARKWPICVQRI